MSTEQEELPAPSINPEEEKQQGESEDVDMADAAPVGSTRQSYLAPAQEKDERESR
jgi:hypothetical protein